MLYERLLQYKESHQMIGFCKWADGEGILFGYVAELDEEHAVFDLIHPWGAADEAFAVALDDLYDLDESPAYVARLVTFGKLVPPVEETKGATTRSARTISARLREAIATGECVCLTIKGESRVDFKVLAMDSEHVTLEEYGDNPYKPVSRRLVKRSQVVAMRWRSSTEIAMTRVWAAM